MSDVMTKEEQAQFEEMRRADAALTQQAPPREPEPEPEPTEPQQPEPELAPPPPPAVETLDEPGPEVDASGRVDKRALDEARRSARQVREQLQREQREHVEAMARLDERFRLLHGAVEQYNAQQQQPAPQQAPPDFNSDPAGYMQHGFQQLGEQVGQLNARLNQSEQTQRQQRELEDLQNWGIAQENEFARQTPDYSQATIYLRDARRGILQVMMPQASEAQIEQQVLMDVASMAVQARATGLNFGKVLYDLAVRHGYQSGRGQAVGGNGAAAGNGGQQAANGGLSPAERLSRGNDMATTLGATGGAARGAPSAEHIAAMSDEEFNRHYAQVQKQGPAALRSLLGS
jgi:hypothetical protein